MTLLLHGQAGGWDELLIAVVGFAVLWIAVKLAGRKPAEADEPVTDGPSELDSASQNSLEVHDVPSDRVPPSGTTRTTPG